MQPATYLNARDRKAGTGESKLGTGKVMNMLITNTESIPGKEIVEILGLAKGNTVRAKWFGKDILAGLRNLVGGELIEYTEMLTESREIALSRMVKDAEALGSGAVVNVRFMTSQITQGAQQGSSLRGLLLKSSKLS